MSTTKSNHHRPYLLIFPLIWFFLHLILLILRSKRAKKPKLIAHQGAVGLAPENRLAAINVGLFCRPDCWADVLA